MELSHFITTLLTEGKVTVQGQFVSFGQPDIAQTEQVLLQYYQDDLQEMPGVAPAYSQEAALWAARYFYAAVQLTVLRDAGEEIIQQRLEAYPGEINVSAIYSADLVLRYLPALFGLAKGLAPADLLVQELHNTAMSWPFSSVGIELEKPVNDDIIFTHPSLKYAYLDRIIRHKDKKRIRDSVIESYMDELTGGYLSALWPNFEAVLK